MGLHDFAIFKDSAGAHVAAVDRAGALLLRYDASVPASADGPAGQSAESGTCRPAHCAAASAECHFFKISNDSEGCLLQSHSTEKGCDSNLTVRAAGKGGSAS